ncbi:hypothetical protein RE6C_01259 [Rhodopirellula europaea 6C]|uniref:Uncharacterized protein n=1 Tax=Rhodopirellula europaea 6C TaxID=1263867 RepID=M2ALN5_9BACT|nr:hypothetical protein RE6C_01259 [Rhodopirellula europaea 6C]
MEIASADTAEHETTRFSVINPHRNLNPLSYVKNRTGGDRNRVTNSLSDSHYLRCNIAQSKVNESAVV